VGDRLHVGGQHGGVGALVLAPLARDLVRGHRRDFRPEFLHLRQRRLLVGRVGVGINKADGDRLDAFGPEIVEDSGQPGKVQRRGLDPLVVDALLQFAAQVALDKGFRLAVFQVEKVGPGAATDLDDVAESLGREQPDLGSFSLGDGVDDDGRPVHKGCELARRDVVGRDDVHHALFELRRGGVALARDDLTVRGHEHQVRKCTSNIRSNSQHIDTLL